MREYLLAGSFAYDTILLHKGKLEARILPESISRLNVAFGIDNVKNEFGGTAGNIAYNASLLQNDPLLIGVLGSDSAPYINHLKEHNLNVDEMTILDDELTAHAWIITDINNNQITAFNAGAMANQPDVPSETPDLWHLSPDNARNMARMVVKAIEKNKKYFFDPGQALPSFIENDAEDIIPLNNIIKHASGIFVNEYEAELLEKKLGHKLIEVVKGDAFLIKTLGGNGLDIYTKLGHVHVPVAQTNRIVDPTGCGDAFRAGFINAYLKGKPLIECAQLGAVMGSFAIEASGGQNHAPTIEQINNRYINSYGNDIAPQLPKNKKPL